MECCAESTICNWVTHDRQLTPLRKLTPLCIKFYNIQTISKSLYLIGLEIWWICGQHICWWLTFIIYNYNYNLVENLFCRHILFLMFLSSFASWIPYFHFQKKLHTLEISWPGQGKHIKNYVMNLCVVFTRLRLFPLLTILSQSENSRSKTDDTFH